MKVYILQCYDWLDQDQYVDSCYDSLEKAENRRKQIEINFPNSLVSILEMVVL